MSAVRRPAVRYGLFDLLAMAADLLAPFLMPLGVAVPVPQPAPQPQPAPPPVVEDRSADVPVIVVAPVAAPASAPEAVAVPLPEPATHRDRLVPAGEQPQALPEYVRRGEGRGARYLLAGPDAPPGPRFVRLAKVNSGRPKYVPAPAVNHRRGRHPRPSPVS